MLDGTADILVGLALAAFAVSVGISVYVLLPRNDAFIFGLKGSALFEALYGEEIAEVHRRLAYDLDRYWDANDVALKRLFLLFKLAAAALVVEIASLITAVSGNL